MRFTECVHKVKEAVTPPTMILTLIGFFLGAVYGMNFVYSKNVIQQYFTGTRCYFDNKKMGHFIINGKEITKETKVRDILPGF